MLTISIKHFSFEKRSKEAYLLATGSDLSLDFSTNSLLSCIMPPSCINLLGNLFDFRWLSCGSVENVEEEGSSSSKEASPLNMKARFVNNVWSGLEYEACSASVEAEGSFDRSLEHSQQGTNTDDDGSGTDDDDDDDDSDSDDETDNDSIHSCHEPQEQHSNMPFLRELPSFGSTLARNSSGMSSYTTRTPSSLGDQSATRGRQGRGQFFVKQPLMGNNGEDEESSTIEIKAGVKPGGNTSKLDQTNSFIFLRQ